MKFEVYNYQCSPAEINSGGMFTESDRQYREEALQAMENHLNIIDDIFTAEDLTYPVGTEDCTIFKQGKDIYLLRPKPSPTQILLNGKKGPTLCHSRMLYAQAGIYVISVQNETVLYGEREWKRIGHRNQPTCLAVLINRTGKQLLLVETHKAFRSTTTVSRIFEHALSKLLAQHKLLISFKPHYSTNSFWEHISNNRKRGVLPKKIKFHFDYPNMAEDSKLLAGFFKKFGTDLNAASEYMIQGQNKQNLNIDDQNRNKDLESLIAYCANTGNTVKVWNSDESSCTFSAKTQGTSMLNASNKMQKGFTQLVEGVNTPSLLGFQNDDKSLGDEIAEWSNSLK